ncbi:MAG: nuclear transport factor 2 family protein [Gammaproteobacteria bacterium]|nr:nuclear transport factor 2 family protein [Gammaproteobacteria bacterium]
MNFADLIVTMTQAACRGDGAAVAACFTPDGIYHDCFYGPFQGTAIATMVEDFFHRDAREFRWDLHDVVDDGRTGYARYVFSYESKLPIASGRRALFEGVSICELRGGKIASYREVANSAVGLYTLGFAPERIAKLLAREARELAARSEAATHR